MLKHLATESKKWDIFEHPLRNKLEIENTAASDHGTKAKASKITFIFLGSILKLPFAHQVFPR